MTLLEGLRSGLRNDAPDGALAMRQRWRLAELRCDGYAFTLLSRIAGALEATGGAEALAAAAESSWALPAGALVLGVRALGLSGFQGAECAALDAELAAWQKAGILATRVRRLPACASVVVVLARAAARWRLHCRACCLQRLRRCQALRGRGAFASRVERIQCNVCKQRSAQLLTDMTIFI